MRNEEWSFQRSEPDQVTTMFQDCFCLKFHFSYTEIAMHDFRYFNSIYRQIVLRRIVNANKTYPHI